MKKVGRKSWTSKLSPERMREFEGHVYSREDRSGGELYDLLGLHRFASKRVVERTVREWRRDAQRRSAHGSTQSSPDSPVSKRALLERTLQSLHTALMLGKIKSSTFPQVIRALTGLFELDVKVEAEKRAAELHRIKMAGLKKDVDKETEGGKKKLSREQMYALIDKYARGDAG